MKRKWLRYRKYMALLVLIIVAGSLYCLTWPRAYEEELADPGPDAETSAPADDSALSEAPQESEPLPCYVYICGEVVNPGVYILNEGQRLFEAVELAGGFTENAAPEALNLVQVIADGMKIDVPDKERAAAMPPDYFVSASGGASSQGAKVNINTAGREQLMTLNGIGASRADAIIAYRQENGAFAQIEDIMKVSGIKEAAFAKIKDYIAVR